MFDILFGWRKASKCKKLIKRVQCRLKLLNNKRYTIVKQLREDVAQLIKIGSEESVFNRAEQLFKDENMMAVYEMLDHFCEFIVTQLSYIRKHKDCPNDINEAVSSLIYASARCGDLPELCVIRKLFGERYGQRFAATALELLPGNLVNREIKEKLSINSVPDNVKRRLVDEIARDYCLRQEILALEYPSGLQQQVKSRQQLLDSYSEIRAIEMDRKAADADSSTRKSFGHSHSDKNSDKISTSISSSIVQQSSPDILESPVHNNSKKVGNSHLDSLCEPRFTSLCTRGSQQAGRIYTSSLKWKEERMTAASSSESLPQFLEETVVYLDDIEEMKSSMMKDEDSQDQRLFKFKSPFLSKEGITLDDECYVGRYDSLSDKSGSINSMKRGKRPRRRSVSQENLIVNDIECMIYYDKLCKSSTSHKHRSNYHRRYPKKTHDKESEQSCYVQKRLKQLCSKELGSDCQSGNCRYDPLKSRCECCFNRKTDVCSLDHPCYFCTGDDKDDREVLPQKYKRGFTTSEDFPIEQLNLYENVRCCSQNQGPVEGTAWANHPQKARRSYVNGATVYNVYTYPHHWPNKQTATKAEKVQRCDSPGSCASSNNCYSKGIGSRMIKETGVPYTRAMTMPQERPKKGSLESILRSNSCSFQYPNHVHPKLPDYDDIAAKFLALKEEHMQNKHIAATNKFGTPKTASGAV